jgi:hypothetical protein
MHLVKPPARTPPSVYTGPLIAGGSSRGRDGRSQPRRSALHAPDFVVVRQIRHRIRKELKRRGISRGLRDRLAREEAEAMMSVRCEARRK